MSLGGVDYHQFAALRRKRCCTYFEGPASEAECSTTIRWTDGSRSSGQNGGA